MLMMLFVQWAVDGTKGNAVAKVMRRPLWEGYRIEDDGREECSRRCGMSGAPEEESGREELTSEIRRLRIMGLLTRVFQSLGLGAQVGAGADASFRKEGARQRADGEKGEEKSIEQRWNTGTVKDGIKRARLGLDAVDLRALSGSRSDDTGALGGIEISRAKLKKGSRERGKMEGRKKGWDGGGPVELEDGQVGVFDRSPAGASGQTPTNSGACSRLALQNPRWLQHGEAEAGSEQTIMRWLQRTAKDSVLYQHQGGQLPGSLQDAAHKQATQRYPVTPSDGPWTNHRASASVHSVALPPKISCRTANTPSIETCALSLLSELRRLHTASSTFHQRRLSSPVIAVELPANSGEKRLGMHISRMNIVTLIIEDCFAMHSLVHRQCRGPAVHEALSLLLHPNSYRYLPGHLCRRRRIGEGVIHGEYPARKDSRERARQRVPEHLVWPPSPSFQARGCPSRRWPETVSLALSVQIHLVKLALQEPKANAKLWPRQAPLKQPPPDCWAEDAKRPCEQIHMILRNPSFAMAHAAIVAFDCISDGPIPLCSLSCPVCEASFLPAHEDSGWLVYIKRLDSHVKKKLQDMAKYGIKCDTVSSFLEKETTALNLGYGFCLSAAVSICPCGRTGSLYHYDRRHAMIVEGAIAVPRRVQYIPNQWAVRQFMLLRLRKTISSLVSLSPILNPTPPPTAIEVDVSTISPISIPPSMKHPIHQPTFQNVSTRIPMTSAPPCRLKNGGGDDVSTKREPGLGLILAQKRVVECFWFAGLPVGVFMRRGWRSRSGAYIQRCLFVSRTVPFVTDP
ncbi:uncharacterized protein BDR25DRAFT_355851 [Lindgomyces ingoldianus]|uniref:Uncharacterized protein n=1 Tax=Lindgomyces ingoldianus TaxID=673940 RepID=A0ACB6QTD5_9PLEO|nr:uncharacterized protein BDR25DRAFT_355851 [Lindgomyces ingoldianus]KAF2470141.1 hypothetical protein BDR25DRAFT_355851 [Lindgomyces ingoldianus]